MINLGKILDYIDKFFKRIKALGYIIAIIFLAMYFINRGFDRKEMLRMTEKITGLNMEKDLLLTQKDNIKSERDSLREENYRIKEQRDSILEEKEKYAWLYQKKSKELKEALKREKEPNKSYDYLNVVAYPFIGPKVYDFNASQVIAMHDTYIENEFNKEIIKTQSSELDECNKALALTKDIETREEAVYAMAEEELAVDDTILDVEEQKTEILTKALKKKDRKEKWKKIWDVTKNVLSFGSGFIVGSLK